MTTFGSSHPHGHRIVWRRPDACGEHDDGVNDRRCVYSISPTSRTFGSAGGTGSVTVTAPADCSWTAVSNSAFLGVTAGAAGSGNGSMSYSVAANTETSRTGTLTIAGQTFTVTQGAPGTLSVNRSTLAFGAVNDGGAVTVETRSQVVTVTQTGGDPAAWSATGDQPWMQITGGTGTGSGTFTLAVAPPATPASGTLTGTITVTSTEASNAPLTVQTTLTIYAPSASTPPTGWFDTPVEGATGLSGSVAVTGWALDDVEVSAVRVFRNTMGSEPAGALLFLGDAMPDPGRPPGRRNRVSPGAARVPRRVGPDVADQHCCQTAGTAPSP